MSENPASTRLVSASRGGLHHVWRTLGPLVALLVVVIFFGVADQIFAGGAFFKPRNLQTVAVQTCVVAVAALGMTLIIIAGGIDLSAGTALALCATMLAWGIREDVVFLVAEGDNFMGASRKLEEAQKELQDARRRGDSQRLTELQTAVDARRERLLEIARLKLADARERLSNAQDETSRETWTKNARSIEEKIRHLKDPEFALHVTPQWPSGVPIAPGTVPLAVCLAILTGVAAGALNGLLISALKVVPFIVTLGTMTVFLGAAKWIAEDTTVRPDRDMVPDWLLGLVSIREEDLLLNFPLGVWLLLLLSLVLAVVLRYTVFSRHIFALGSNEATARLCGIQVPWLKVAVYSLAGLFVGLAGMYQFARLSVGNPTSGTGLELKIIAAVVIGGGSLSGGQGSVLGTLTGALIMQVIASGCNALGLSNSVQDIINGVIIIAAVTLDQIRQRRMAA